MSPRGRNRFDVIHKYVAIFFVADCDCSVQLLLFSVLPYMRPTSFGEIVRIDGVETKSACDNFCLACVRACVCVLAAAAAVIHFKPSFFVQTKHNAPLVVDLKVTRAYL